MKKQDLHKLAMERMDEAYEADVPNRDMALDDLRFLTGEQWPEDIRKQREAEGKPCLTLNMLPQNVRQVTAQIRGLNPAIKVSPSDRESSREVAEIYGGLVRHIENKCSADSLYEAAAESAAQCGIGNFRVRTDYCGHDSFDQEILIERIANPFAVFWDPLAKDPTRKDARYCFIVEDVAKEVFKKQYPNASPLDVTDNHRQYAYSWITAETVTVAEYLWVDHDEYEIVQVGPRVVKASDLPPGFPKEDPMTGEPYRRRRVKKPKVMWAKIANSEVLEGPTEMPCSQLPVFAVTGEEIHVGEEKYRSSVVRFSKDAMTLYNAARSSQAELTTLQPRAPFMVTSKQVHGLEDIWAKANTSNRPYLVYNPDEKAPGAPQRMQPPVSSQGLMAEIQLAAEDVKRTTGIYDAALGARSNETSGVAINARKVEAQNATSIYADNMVKAVSQCGRVIVEMIPRIYDAERYVQILGEDDQEKMVLINQVLMGPNGEEVILNDMTAGRYDVRVSVGPSFQTLRQEAAEGQMEFLRVVPEARQFVADLIAGNQAWPEAERVAERLRKMLPPGMEEEEEPTPEQMQARQQQMQAQQMAQEMAMRKEQAELKKAEAEAAEAEADAMKAQAEAAKADLELRATMGPIVQQPQFGAF